MDPRLIGLLCSELVFEFHLGEFHLADLLFQYQALVVLDHCTEIFQLDVLFLYLCCKQGLCLFVDLLFELNLSLIHI